MAHKTEKMDSSKFNGTIDITKLLMAILVIGIHTEPFGFNFWLDKGFGICTRLCVPFFFITSAYFFWKTDKPASSFLKRIIILYAVWSAIYLPFDITTLKSLSFIELLDRFLWSGNEHALWYLCGTIIGFVITYFLLKVFKPKTVILIGLLLLIIGTLKSTYSTAFESILGVSLPDNLGSRNGLFYGFPYMALGMAIAKSKSQGLVKNKIWLYGGFVFSLILLAIESYLFVIKFKADSTILWLSVFPCTFFFFELALNTNIQVNRLTAITFRKVSTLMYVSQYLFIPLLSGLVSNILLFVITTLITATFAFGIIKLSEIKQLRFLKYLY